MTSTMKLMEPLTIGKLKLPNRIVMAPMTRGRCEGERDMFATAAMAQYYAQRASAGLIISEGTAISEQSIGWWRAPCIYTEAHAEAWKRVTNAVHAEGGHIFCQLWHCGRASHSSFRPDAADGRAVAPSAIAMKEHSMGFTPAGKVPHETPRELTIEEIEAIPGDYANAAKMAKLAGFDGIEIHSANGYLLDEFLQSVSNKRTDKYGGSMENRFRLLKAVVEAVLTVFPSHSVGVRLSPNGMFNEMGDPQFREIFLQYAKWLSPYNLGYLHIMNGLGFGFHEKGEPMQLSEFRAVYDGLIMANCGYTKEQAEKDVHSGDCDMVSIGRPFIGTPNLVERWAKGLELNSDASPAVYYSPPGTNLGAKGLSDFPPAE